MPSGSRRPLLDAAGDDRARANGYGANGQSKVAKDPPLDCFYVYPTVSRDQGMNSDLNPSEENGAAQVQFARFAGVCRTLRQSTAR